MDQMRASGSVSVELIANDRTRSAVCVGSNTLSFRCADAVASLFAGRRDGLPSVVAFVCGETGDLGASFQFEQGDRGRDQRAIVGTGLLVEDVRINPSPAISSSADEYTGNRVTFSAITTDNTRAKYVYGFLLKDGNGPDARVLAVKKLAAPTMKPENYAMSMSWAVTFA